MEASPEDVRSGQNAQTFESPDDAFFGKKDRGKPRVHFRQRSPALTTNRTGETKITS